MQRQVAAREWLVTHFAGTICSLRRALKGMLRLSQLIPQEML